MKLILLSLPLLLTAGMLFAQSNEAHIEQVGTFHEGYIQQESVNTPNGSQASSLTSNGLDGSMLGIPFQNNSGLPDFDSNSFAEIMQYDSDNSAAILQSGSHWAQIFQLGLNNLATILQEDADNGSIPLDLPAIVVQCTDIITPCGGLSHGGSTASIYQEGDRNDASIEQKDGNNEAEIIQYGSDLEAIIHQYGDKNYASIMQDFRGFSLLSNASGFRSAEILQTNNNNVATVEQSVPTQLPIQIVQDGNMAIHIEHHTQGADEWWVN